MFKELARKIGLAPQEISAEDRKYDEFKGKFADWLVVAGFIGQPFFERIIEEGDRNYALIAFFDGGRNLTVKIIADSFSQELNIDEYWEYSVSRNSSNVYLYHERIMFSGNKSEVNWGEYKRGEPTFSPKGLSTPPNEDVFKAFENLMKVNPTAESTSSITLTNTS